MANLTFSNTLATELLIGSATGQGNPLIYSTATALTSAMSNSLAGGAANSTALYIFKGVKPTTFAGFTDITQRSSDLLITFQLPAVGTAVTDVGNIGNVSRRFVIGKQPTPTVASASGLATWFLTCATWSTSLTDKSVLMGTVGGPSSGADLLLSNANVVSGANYTSLGFTINFFYAWIV